MRPHRSRRAAVQAGLDFSATDPRRRPWVQGVAELLCIVEITPFLKDEYQTSYSAAEMQVRIWRRARMRQLPSPFVSRTQPTSAADHKASLRNNRLQAGYREAANKVARIT